MNEIEKFSDEVDDRFDNGGEHENANINESSIRQSLLNNKVRKQREQQDDSSGNDSKNDIDNLLDNISFSPDFPHADDRHSTGYARKHKYSTADLPVITPCKKCCSILFFLIVSLVAVFAMGYVVQLIFNSPELVPDNFDANEDIDDQHAYHNDKNKLLRRSREFISAVCAPEKLAGLDHIYCEDACQDYQGCCKVYSNSNGNNSCFYRNTARCYSHAKCGALNNESAIDAAPTYIDQVCHPAALAIDRTNCERICEPVQCCWNYETFGVTSCIAKRFSTCQDYSYCQNLRVKKKNGVDDEHILPVAPSNLDKECQDDTPLCHKYCKEAVCCQQPYSDCYRDNLISCISYMSCNNSNQTIIDIAIPKDSLFEKAIPKPPFNLDDVCATESLSHDAVICELHCEKASCCFDSGRLNCFGSDPLGCLSYLSCSSLQPDLPVTFDSTSDFKDTGGNQNFNSEVEEITPFMKNRVYMNNLCSQKKISNNEGFKDCQEKCKTVECCDPFRESATNSTCYTTNIVGCYNYAKCHAINGIFPPAPLELDYRCTKDSIVENRTQCEILCEDVRCCWDDALSPCIASNFLACQDYASCQNLRNGPIIDIAPRGLDVECRDNTRFCVDECAKSMSCCKDPFSTCYRYNVVACISHMICPTFTTIALPAEIYSELPGLSSIMKEEKEMDKREAIDFLNQVCSPEYIIRKGHDECETICDIASCCFKSGKLNCFGNDPLSCLEFLPCRVLYQSPTFALDVIAMNDNITFLESREAINFACSLEYLQSQDGYKACEEICEPYLSGCCDPYRKYEREVNGTNNFQDAVAQDDIYKGKTLSDSCFYQHITGCYNYARCSALDGYLLAAPNEIERKCSFESLQLNGIDECEKLCLNGGCCWDPKVKSCLATKFTSCLDYSHCQNLRRYLTESSSDNGIFLFNMESRETSSSPIVSNEDVMPVAKDDLDTICASQSSQECLVTCSNVSNCCNDMFSNCFRNNFLSCISYGTCAKHHDFVTNDIPIVNKVVPPIPKDAYSICDEQYFLTYGDQECFQYCEAGACCFKHDDNGSASNGELKNCFGDDPLGCLEYLPCEVVFKN